MSTGLELVPLALAAAGVLAAGSRRIEQRRSVGAASVLTLPTRLLDERLLVRALTRVADDAQKRDGVWCGSIGGTPLALTRRSDGGYDAHFDASLSIPQAEAALRELDAAYCAELQQGVYAQLVRHAPERGMSVVDQYEEEDGTIVVTLQLQDDLP